MASLDDIAEGIQRARREKRWVDASVDLERWLSMTKNVYLAGTAELPESVSQGTRWGFGPKRFRSEEEELRKLVGKTQKSIDKSNHSERVTYLSFVNKHNAHGKVQARLLVMTGSALYNFDQTGAKLKRRIALTAIGSVSANDVSGQFVLHVPREYDYHFSAPTHGYTVGGDDQAAMSTTPLAGMIVALQQAYGGTMGGSPDSPNLLAVRNITSEADLSRYVQKKGQGGVPDAGRMQDASTADYDDLESD